VAAVLGDAMAVTPGLKQAVAKDQIKPITDAFYQHYKKVAGILLLILLFTGGVNLHYVNQVVTFVIIAATLYFLVVVPLHRLLALRRTEPPVDTPTRECPECLSSIPVAARRCAFCTAEVAGAR